MSIQQDLIVKVKSHGHTQVALARKAGLTQKHVSQMLTGKAEGSLSAWQALADAAKALDAPEGPTCFSGRDHGWHYVYIGLGDDQQKALCDGNGNTTPVLRAEDQR